MGKEQKRQLNNYPPPPPPPPTHTHTHTHTHTSTCMHASKHASTTERHWHAHIHACAFSDPNLHVDPTLFYRWCKHMYVASKTIPQSTRIKEHRHFTTLCSTQCLMEPDESAMGAFVVKPPQAPPLLRSPSRLIKTKRCGHLVQVKRCFTSTETMRTIRTGSPGRPLRGRG